MQRSGTLNLEPSLADAASPSQTAEPVTPVASDGMGGVLESVMRKAHWVNSDPKKLKITVRFDKYSDYQDALRCIAKSREGVIYAHQSQT